MGEASAACAHVGEPVRPRGVGLRVGLSPGPGGADAVLTPLPPVQCLRLPVPLGYWLAQKRRERGRFERKGEFLGGEAHGAFGPVAWSGVRRTGRPVPYPQLGPEEKMFGSQVIALRASAWNPPGDADRTVRISARLFGGKGTRTSARG